MTLAEFFGCACLAFGAPLAMFTFTIAHDPIRIIILIAAAFFWLLALLLSSLVWFIVVPFRGFLAFGLVFSVIYQEAFRYVIYKILRKTEKGLQEVADNVRVTENKHILAYVSGLGFGIISGAFAIINILADAVGPATMGLLSGSEIFFLTSSAQTLCTILLHTFWSVIFFNALDTSRYTHIAYVVLSHLFVSCLTLLNRRELYWATLLPNYTILLVTAIMAFRVVGGSMLSFRRFITCK
ncbi:gamma-secretase subunit Aph-1 [Lutzomyia longipalpis]|uniref:gamma-secretase subunit Aph-1 n=1 Tax=Lutzomyia longipalpis TaxID=7200 RepID=UPI002484543C|nr:gamma-secretase subunit Aph-1 [Lutzomyia longipalpis]